MRAKWVNNLKYDPISPLLASNNLAVVTFAERELRGDIDEKIEKLWALPEAQKIVNKQQKDGCWRYPGGNHQIRTAENYNQLESFRQLGYLVEKFGFNINSKTITQAAEYLFSFQTKDGDIRGILGNQYTPYYTAAILELLIKAGYQDDARVIRAFDWLKNIRQNDGGWAIPLRTTGRKLDAISMGISTIEPDKTKPFSSLITGIVLRAYAAHPQFKNSTEAQTAGKLLLSSLFKPDNYPDRKGKDYWVRFTFPFWFTDLISALDSLSKLDFSLKEPEISKACEWFIENQNPDGTWKLKILKNLKHDSELWLSLSICRIFKRLY